jgi:hypothetical protein
MPRKLKRHAKHWAAKGLTSGEEHSKTLKSFRPSSRGPSFFANTLPADPQARAQLVKQFSAAAADTFRDPQFDPVTHAAVENFFPAVRGGKGPPSCDETSGWRGTEVRRRAIRGGHPWRVAPRGLRLGRRARKQPPGLPHRWAV